VISGSVRGRLIVAPPGEDIRPTTDKTRSAMFNALISRNMIQDATVVDLFAGTGSVGIEALSRGATRATFVDSDRTAVDCTKYNLEHLNLNDQSSVIKSDVNRWLDSTSSSAFQVDEDSPLVVFADPPYAFTAWPELLERLHPRLAPLGVDALAVLESGKTIELPDNWELEREARYGAAYVTFARPLATGLPSAP
jgi:16S rRNA (guanine966-N2)-methyltransferase